MRRDTSFLERKLTREEFNKKYLMDGECDCQFHSTTFEDGRDEREQLIFNNLMALWENDKFLIERQHNSARTSYQELLEIMEKRTKRITALAVTSAAISLAVLCVALWLKFF